MVCPICGKHLERKKINLGMSILICPDINCPYPVGREVKVFEEKEEALSGRTASKMLSSKSIMPYLMNQELDSTAYDLEQEKTIHYYSELCESPCTSTSLVCKRTCHSHLPPFKRSNSARSIEHQLHHHPCNDPSLSNTQIPKMSSSLYPPFVHKRSDSDPSIDHYQCCELVRRPSMSASSLPENSSSHFPSIVRRSGSHCSMDPCYHHYGELSEGPSKSTFSLPENSNCHFPSLIPKRSDSVDSIEHHHCSKVCERPSVSALLLPENSNCQFPSFVPKRSDSAHSVEHEHHDELFELLSESSLSVPKKSSCYSPSFGHKKSASADFIENHSELVDRPPMPTSLLSEKPSCYSPPNRSDASFSTEHHHDDKHFERTSMSAASLPEKVSCHFPPFVPKRSDSAQSVEHHHNAFCERPSSSTSSVPENPNSHFPPFALKRSESACSIEPKKPKPFHHYGDIFEGPSASTFSATGDTHCCCFSERLNTAVTATTEHHYHHHHHGECFEGPYTSLPPPDPERPGCSYSPPFVPRAQSANSVEHHPHYGELFCRLSTTLSPTNLETPGCSYLSAFVPKRSESACSAEVQQNVDYSLDFELKTEDVDLRFSQELISPKSELSFSYDPHDFIDFPSTSNGNVEFHNPTLGIEQETAESTLSNLLNEIAHSSPERAEGEERGLTASQRTAVEVLVNLFDNIEEEITNK